MWFCAVYAVGGTLGIIAVIFDLGRFLGGYSMGGMPVSRDTWLTVAAPLVAMIACLMGATAMGFKRGRRWARFTFMSIWPVIILYGVGTASIGLIPWSLGLRAFIDATLAGAIAAWLLFGHKPSRAFFSETPR